MAKKISNKSEKQGNRLFPVFLQLEKMNVLIVGGGAVAMEKLTAILQNSPNTSIHVVAKEFLPAFKSLAKKAARISITKKAFDASDLEGKQIVISAVNSMAVSKKIHAAATKKGVLHNAADKPSRCDFYLGSVVKKGHLKIAISTNGKSPTVAKRLRESLHELLPDQIDDILCNLTAIRNSLKGDLAQKIQTLNAITSVLMPEKKKVRDDGSSWESAL